MCISLVHRCYHTISFPPINDLISISPISLFLHTALSHSLSTSNNQKNASSLFFSLPLFLLLLLLLLLFFSHLLRLLIPTAGSTSFFLLIIHHPSSCSYSNLLHPVPFPRHPSFAYIISNHATFSLHLSLSLSRCLIFSRRFYISPASCHRHHSIWYRTPR